MCLFPRFCLHEYATFNLCANNPVNKTTYDKETWVLDIRATDHIVHSVKLFTKITNSVSSFVQLPNGERVVVTHIGTIQVIASLVLENMPCILAFTFNLISVNQLTKCLSCCFVFLYNMCFIQDLSCWKIIGVGKLHNNLYLLQSSTSCKSNSAVSSILESILVLLLIMFQIFLSLPSHTFGILD